MYKLQNIARPLTYPLALILYSVAFCGQGQPNTARIEQVRQDFGYYKTGVQQNTKDLTLQIRALREEIRQTREQMDSRLQGIEQSLQPGTESHSTRQPLLPLMANPFDVSDEAKRLSACHQDCDVNYAQKSLDHAALDTEFIFASKPHRHWKPKLHHWRPGKRSAHRRQQHRHRYWRW
jgi:hypothetical protein